MIYWNEYMFDDFVGVDEAFALANRKDNQFCVFVNLETQAVWVHLKIGDVWPVYPWREIALVHYNYSNGRFSPITKQELLDRLSEAVVAYMDEMFLA